MSFDLQLMLSLVALSCAAAAALACCAEAAAPHPRLYFTAKDLPRLARFGYATPGYLDEQSFRSLDVGDTDIVFPLPPRQPPFMENPPGFDPKLGRYPYWTSMARHIQVRLESLALSYAVTGDRRYARRAIDYLLALAQWQTWSEPDGGDGSPAPGAAPQVRPVRSGLDTCHLTIGAAFAYDVCWQAMSPSERETAREALHRLGVSVLARDAPVRVEHSLQMLRNAALGLGGLAVLPEQPEAWPHVESAIEFFVWWLDARQASPNTEGLAHTAYGLDHCLLMAAALAHAEGNRRLIDHPHIARAVRWALSFWAPRASGLVNFCGAGAAHPFEVTMRVANKYHGDPYAGYYLQQTGLLTRRGFAAVVLHNPDPAIAWPPPWAASAVFPNIGWAALRSGWGETDTLFAFISSSSREAHCHLDADHFVINCAGEWLATDASNASLKGGELADFGQGTAGHNSILIGGAAQREKAGAITDFFSSPIFDYVVGDASRCYDPQLLWRYLRRVVYVKPHFFAMLDELEAPEPRRFELLLHTDADGGYAIDGKAARLGATATAQRVSLLKPGATLDVRFLEPAAPQLTFDHYKGAKGESAPYITARDSRPRESQRFLTALVPTPKPEAQLRLELEKYAPEPNEALDAPEPDAAGRVARLATLGALLFRARKPGDALTLSLPVPADGVYGIVGRFMKSPACGNWQARIDGIDAGAEYHGYAPDVRTGQEWDLGAARLAAGRHEFSFAATGKSDAASGYFVGLDEIEFRPVGKPAWVQGSTPTRFRRLGGDGWSGASCVLTPPEADGRQSAPKKRGTARSRARPRPQPEGVRCRVYFRLTGADEIADKDLRTDADAMLVIDRPFDEPEVAAYRATRVVIGGHELIEASTPIDFALVPGKRWSLTLESDRDGEVVVYLHGQPLQPSVPPSLARGVRYSPAPPSLRIRLRPGSHTLTWMLK